MDTEDVFPNCGLSDMSKAPKCDLESLTKELLHYIFKYLDPRSLGNARTVCHALKCAVDGMVSQVRIGFIDGCCGPKELYRVSQMWPAVQRLKLCCLKPSDDVPIRNLDGLHDIWEGLLHSNWSIIEVLDASGCEFTVGSGAAIAACSVEWPSLQYVNLQSTNIDILNLADLALGSYPQLEMLNLRGSVILKCSEDRAAVGILLAQLVFKCPKLRNIDLSLNKLGIEGLGTLFNVGLDSLERLNLSSTGLKGPEAPLFLNMASRWPHLQELCLEGNCLDDDAIIRLSNNQWTTLERLSIGIRELGIGGAKALAEAAHRWPILRKLELDAACRDSIPAAALSIALNGNWGNLKELSLVSGAFDREKGKVLASALYHGRLSNLTSLRLSPIDMDGDALAEVLKFNLVNIKHLSIRIPRIECAGVLGRTIRNGRLPALKSIEFDNFYLSDIHFELLFARTVWSTVEEMSFASCCCLGRGMCLLAASAEQLPALRVLSMWEGRKDLAGDIKRLLEAPWKSLQRIQVKEMVSELPVSGKSRLTQGP